MKAVLSTWPFSLLQRLPRMKQVFCPPAAALDVAQVAAYCALSEAPGAAAAVAQAANNLEDNRYPGLVVVDSGDFEALARGVCAAPHLV